MNNVVISTTIQCKRYRCLATAIGELKWTSGGNERAATFVVDRPSNRLARVEVKRRVRNRLASLFPNVTPEDELSW